MRMTGLMSIAAAATLSLGACATDRYGYQDNNDRQINRAAAGAAIGAAAGAGVGAVVDGVNPIEGAAVGAVAGGVIGAVTSGNDRRWQRDRRGYCYYFDDRGRAIYDYNRRC